MFFPHAFVGEIVTHALGTMTYRAVFLPEELAVGLPFQGRPRLRFEGAMNDLAWSGAWQPSGDGRRYAMVSPKLLRAADLRVGDLAQVRFRVADQTLVEPPPELVQALGDDETLRAR